VIGGGRGQEEEGEGLDDEEDEIAELEQRLRMAKLPEHALKAAKKELKVQNEPLYSFPVEKLREPGDEAKHLNKFCAIFVEFVPMYVFTCV
jgi:hypothetical protein